jgi:neopullulanase
MNAVFEMKKRFVTGLLFVLIIAIGSLNAQPRGTAIQCWPHEWWVGMKNNHLLLLLYGTDMSLNTAAITYPGVRIVKQYPATSRSYLFVEIEIQPNATPTTFPIQLNHGGRIVGSFNFNLLARKGAFLPRKLTGADVIYQIVPDRFVNDNSGNDNVTGFFERSDRMNPSGIHGGDFAGVIKASSYLRQLGITSIELTPVYESNQLVLSYERFAPTNFYKVDPRLGTMTELASLVTHYRSSDIKVILTKVLHKTGNQNLLAQNPPSTDWLLSRGTQASGNVNPIVFGDPYASREDLNRHGKRWDAFDTPSWNHNNEDLRRFLIQNVIWWIESVRPDGLKIDKSHLSSTQLLAELSQTVNREYPEINLISSPRVDILSHNSFWKNGNDNAFAFTHVSDMPLYSVWEDGFAEYLKSEEALHNIYRVIAGDRIYMNPASQLVFTGDNHDLTRMFTLAEKDIGIFRMYMGFLLTVRGIPSFLYGTEILMEGLAPEGAGFVRGGFPGGWRDDRVSAFNPATLSNMQREGLRFVTAILNWRKQNPEIMQGTTIHFEPRDDVYAFMRVGGDKKLLVILNNNPDSARRLEQSRFAESTGKISQVINVVTGEMSSGLGNLILNPKSIVILELSGN